MRSALAFLPRIFTYMRPYRHLPVISGVIILLATVASLLEPWPLALLIDTVLANEEPPDWITALVGEGTGPLILFAVLAGLFVTLMSGALGILNDYVLVRLEQRMILDFRSDLFRHAERLSMAFHDQRLTGEMLININQRASALGAVAVAIPPLAQSVLTLVGMFVIVYRLHSTLALISLAVVPFIYYSTGYYATRITPRLRTVRGMEGKSIQIVHEALNMMRVILAFGRERHEYEKFRSQGEKAVDARVKVTVRQTGFSLAVNLITAAGTALVLGFGAYAVLRGELTVGQLLVVMAYIAAVYAPLHDISATFASFQEKGISLEGAFALLDESIDVEDPPDGIELDRAQGHVVFEDVSFSYAERPGTLKKISFEAKPGEFVGIVGPTGAGKSTLVNLMPRFSDPESGRILLDGQDIRTIRLESLRRQFSVVLQEPLLFVGPIKENIAYGRLDATREEVVEAARAANADEFIRELPKKYLTRVGERGSRLSGGERQRIAVARAFLKDAPVLILDEPTSSIDSKTEAVILDALQRLAEGRTTFMIAHRLSSVRRADRILVLDHGRLVQQGTHEELLVQEGMYRQMYSAQIGEDALRGLIRRHEQRAGSDGTAAPSEVEAKLGTWRLEIEQSAMERKAKLDEELAARRAALAEELQRRREVLAQLAMVRATSRERGDARRVELETSYGEGARAAHERVNGPGRRH